MRSSAAEKLRRFSHVARMVVHRPACGEDQWCAEKNDTRGGLTLGLQRGDGAHMVGSHTGGWRRVRPVAMNLTASCRTSRKADVEALLGKPSVAGSSTSWLSVESEKEWTTESRASLWLSSSGVTGVMALRNSTCD
ncbi:hypothetical protein GUJ93_ZPchr0007g3644 [Zizania palustris]|uniref:Uncharacterized protein n=1 Tax=Zizania palustris TaxID=103762 RepID=A0A8J5TES9_ZIZPA|nr:hypothetical protein GUJ93_ZPchr0007g3644 [Zizania palustris]